MDEQKEKHIDPLRFPNIQGRYEKEAKEAFNPGTLFSDIVKTMVEIVKEKTDKK